MSRVNDDHLYILSWILFFIIYYCNNYRHNYYNNIVDTTQWSNEFTVEVSISLIKTATKNNIPDVYQTTSFYIKYKLFVTSTISLLILSQILFILFLLFFLYIFPLLELRYLFFQDKYNYYIRPSIIIIKYHHLRIKKLKKETWN